MNYKNVLLSNDDGYDSIGLKIVEKYFKSVGVYPTTVAPLEQKSGASSSITICGKLIVKKVADKVFAVDGTPVDCVKIATKNLLKELPDLVVSGINKGDNTGQSVIYSGTIGAVLESARQEIDSVAFSFYTAYKREVDFNEESLFLMVKDFFENNYSGGFVSVNLPNCDYSKFKGFKNMPISKATFVEKYTEVEEGVFEVGLDSFKEEHKCETISLKENWGTISPMMVDWTDYTRL